MKKVLRVCIGVVVVATAVVVGLLVWPTPTTQPFTADDYKYDLSISVEIEGDIPVMSQRTGYTCGIVSMALLRTFLGAETDEDDLQAELGVTNRGTGFIPKDYLPYVNRTLEPTQYSVTLLNPTSQAEILNIITESLMDGRPVVIFYSAVDDWNKPHWNTHYAMVYGIDMRAKTVQISNPYGYLQSLTFTELFDGLSFASYEDEPLGFLLGRKVGTIAPNNLFILKQN